MTENEVAILTKLVALDAGTRAWHRVHDLGGIKGSHHTVTASRMVQKHWIARQRRGGGEKRPAWAYMITAAGEQALYNHFLPKIEARRLRLAAGG